MFCYVAIDSQTVNFARFTKRSKGERRACLCSRFEHVQNRLPSGVANYGLHAVLE